MILKPKSFLARSGVIGLAFVGIAVQGLRAQTPARRDTLLTAAQVIIKAARYSGLATFDESGRVRIRTMDPFPPEADMVVWMGTHRRSRKVRDIENDPRVTLYYNSPTGSGYVAISGTAHLVDDPTEKDARWKEEWGAFYVDREADYLLIRVEPNRLEVIDYSRGIQGDPETWEPPFVVFPGGESPL